MKYIPYLVAIACGFLFLATEDPWKKALFLAAAVLYPILIEQWLENRKRPQPRPRVSPIPDTYQLGMQVDYLIEECRWARGRIGQLEGRLEAQESAQ